MTYKLSRTDMGGWLDCSPICGFLGDGMREEGGKGEGGWVLEGLVARLNSCHTHGTSPSRVMR